MTIVLPHGVLFRGGDEGRIRKNLIENNNIDAIIGLPANIFFGTGIPTIVMVLKKGRTEDDVLIIDASKGFMKEGKNNKLRARDIKRIADTYIARTDIEHYSRRVSRSLIRDNEYNLNIPRYVDSSDAADSIDIYATMFGGIPKSEVRALEEEFDAFPTLESELFTDSDTPYVALKCDDIKQTITNNRDVVSFIASYNVAFADFIQFMYHELIDNMRTVLISREESIIAEDIFRRLHDIPLIDKYEAYQVLDDGWQIIASDLEVIQTEGIEAITQVDANLVVKKKDGKDIEVQDGWIGHILPFELVQRMLLSDDLSAISAKEDDLAALLAEYEEIIDSIPEEDRGDFLNDDNTAFVPKEIAKIIKPYTKGKLKPEAESIEETLLRVDALMTKEKNLKKDNKQAKAELHIKTKETIESLSYADTLPLLTEKWIIPITEGLYAFPESIIQTMEKKIKELAEKYDTTYLDIETELEQSEKTLSSMIDSLTGNDFDMMGLAELKKLLEVGNND